MTNRSRGRKPAGQKSLAKERITGLFQQAETAFKEKPELAHRYVELARAMGMRYRVHIPKEFKKAYCKHCHHYLKPGVNCTVRLSQKRQSKVVVTCKDCNGVMRYPYQKEKTDKKKTKEKA